MKADVLIFVAATLATMITTTMSISKTEEVKVQEIPTIDFEIVAWEPEEADEEIEYYDVPLDEDIQEHIFATCEEYDVSPEIVIAVIERESQFDSATIGDNGKSVGLMQIQSRWHQERMDRLGCNDLADPFQNITVGVDYLAELQANDPDVYWVLMAYNGGPSYANKMAKKDKVSEYAASVVKRTKELKGSEEDGFESDI